MNTTITRLSDMRSAVLGLIQLAKDDLDSLADTRTEYGTGLRQEIAQHMTTVAILTIEITRLMDVDDPQGTPWNDVPEPN